MSNKYLIFLIIISFFLSVQTAAEEYPNPSGHINTVHFFAFCRTCGESKRIEEKLKSLQGFNEKFIIKYYYLKESGITKAAAELEKCLKIKINEFPAVVIGEDVFQGEKLFLKNISRIQDVLTGEEIPDYMEISRLNYSILDYNAYIMRRLSLPVILTAAILDSINPCALTTFFILLSYMGSISREKKLIAAAAFFFIGTVFITYTLIGLGFLEGTKTFMTGGKLKITVKFLIAGLIFFFCGSKPCGTV